MIIITTKIDENDCLSIFKLVYFKEFTKRTMLYQRHSFFFVNQKQSLAIDLSFSLFFWLFLFCFHCVQCAKLQDFYDYYFSLQRQNLRFSPYTGKYGQKKPVCWHILNSVFFSFTEDFLVIKSSKNDLGRGRLLRN